MDYIEKYQYSITCNINNKNEMMDSVYQSYFQQNKQPVIYRQSEYREKRDIVKVQSQIFLRQNELMKKNAELVQLKRRPSLLTSNSTRTQTGLSRHSSFSQSVTQMKQNQLIQDEEFEIVNFETSTIALQNEISNMQKNYTRLEITNEVHKRFVKEFMTLWRQLEQTEGKYNQLMKVLPTSHEYTQILSIQRWLPTLRKKLWALRELITKEYTAYQLRRKEEEQIRILEEYFSEVSSGRDYVTSPVGSDFGSDITNFSTDGSNYSI